MKMRYLILMAGLVLVSENAIALDRSYYDNNGNRTRSESSDGSYTKYNYVDGKLDSGISYDSSGNVSKTISYVYNNDGTTNEKWFVDGVINRVTTYPSNVDVRKPAQYQGNDAAGYTKIELYDADGNLSIIHEYQHENSDGSCSGYIVKTPSGVATRVVNYTYDYEDGQIVRGYVDGRFSYSWTYDKYGNREYVKDSSGKIITELVFSNKNWKAGKTSSAYTPAELTQKLNHDNNKLTIYFR